MGYLQLAITSTIGLFFGMLLMLEAGRWIAIGRAPKSGEAKKGGFGPIVGAIFSLLGLLIAFSFSGAATRFDTRRQLGVQEINAIQAAYRLIDLLPETQQAELKQDVRNYVDAELEAIKKLPDIAAAQGPLARRSASLRDIENKVATIYKNPDTKPAASILLPAINQWADISATRTADASMHPPALIFIMLTGLALVGSLVAGYGMAESESRSWLHMIAFAAVVSLTIYVIVDLEFPRFGFIRLDASDRLLTELRQSLH